MKVTKTIRAVRTVRNGDQSVITETTTTSEGGGTADVQAEMDKIQADIADTLAAPFESIVKSLRDMFRKRL